ncbi:MAG: pyridoxal-dependent decarboxylase [Synechococcaceae cyanobacterium]|nr:pyridoxal-dependent decarboxylase [Synechococcaceae cyanobacterium]
MASAPFAQRPEPQPSPAPPPFASPLQADPALESLLQQASALLCNWIGGAAAGQPLPPLSVLPGIEPEAAPLAQERLLADLQLVVDGAYNPHHPGAIAHLDPPPLTGSIVAELICAGLNNNLLAEELSPTLSRLERSLGVWLARQLGLPEGAGGVAASGGSLSNLMALVVARHQAGLSGDPQAVLLCSSDAHVSFAKALAVMGLPPTALERLPVDAAGRLDPEALECRLAHCQSSGRPPIAVVATAGTTVCGAVDPLASIGPLCRRHGVWLHVDGAIGAVFALAPAHRHRVEGLEWADSVTVNPQKLLGITKTSSLLLMARPALLQQAFATGLPYMEPSWGGGHGGEAGLQGTRPAEILKLWLGLRQLGLEGISAVIDAAVSRRRRLQTLLSAEPRLQLLAGPLHLLAFRPLRADPAASERWSAATRQALLNAQLMLSRPMHHGHHHLKAVLGNPHTGEAELQRLVQIVRASLDD